jgi:hypothetical protein
MTCMANRVDRFVNGLLPPRGNHHLGTSPGKGFGHGPAQTA